MEKGTNIFPNHEMSHISVSAFGHFCLFTITNQREDWPQILRRRKMTIGETDTKTESECVVRSARRASREWPEYSLIRITSRVKEWENERMPQPQYSFIWSNRFNTQNWTEEMHFIQFRAVAGRQGWGRAADRRLHFIDNHFLCQIWNRSPIAQKMP